MEDTKALFIRRSELLKHWCPNEIIHGLLAVELSSRQVRIVNWLKADPVSVLESSHIVCSVHLSGSNTYHEAIRSVYFKWPSTEQTWGSSSARVPQVILA